MSTKDYIETIINESNELGSYSSLRDRLISIVSSLGKRLDYEVATELTGVADLVWTYKSEGEKTKNRILFKLLIGQENKDLKDWSKNISKTEFSKLIVICEENLRTKLISLNIKEPVDFWSHQSTYIRYILENKPKDFRKLCKMLEREVSRSSP